MPAIEPNSSKKCSRFRAGEGAGQARRAQRLHDLICRSFLGDDELARRVGAGFDEVFTGSEAPKALGVSWAFGRSTVFVKAQDDDRLQPWSPGC